MVGDVREVGGEGGDVERENKKEKDEFVPSCLRDAEPSVGSSSQSTSCRASSDLLVPLKLYYTIPSLLSRGRADCLGFVAIPTSLGLSKLF